MPIPRFVARFNRSVTNPIARLVAGCLPPFAIVLHRGHLSGRSYGTPVAAFRSAGGFVSALTYGSSADWVRNVLNAGGCTLVRRGSRRPMTDPVVVTGPDGMRLVPWVVRPPLRLLRASEFLRLSERTA